MEEFFKILVSFGVSLIAYIAGRKTATADLSKEAFKEIDKKLTQQAEQKVKDDALISDLRKRLYAEYVRSPSEISTVAPTVVFRKDGKP